MIGVIDYYDSDYDYRASNFQCSLEEYENLEYALVEEKEKSKTYKEALTTIADVLEDERKLGTERAKGEALKMIEEVICDVLEGKATL